MPPSNVTVLNLQNSNGLEYLMYPLDTSNLDERKPSSVISPPGLSSDQAIRLPLGGQEDSIRLDFFLWDNGEDRSNGTNATQVITVSQQADYLREEFYDAGVDVEFTIFNQQSFQNTLLTSKTGNIENLSIDLFGEGNVKWTSATITIGVGDVI